MSQFKNSFQTWQHKINTTHIHHLAHLPLVPHIFVSESGQHCCRWWLASIRRQAIIQTNAWLLWIGHLGTNFNDLLINIQNFLLTRMHLTISSAKWRPFHLGGDEFERTRLLANGLDYWVRLNAPLSVDCHIRISCTITSRFSNSTRLKWINSKV